MPMEELRHHRADKNTAGTSSHVGNAFVAQDFCFHILSAPF